MDTSEDTSPVQAWLDDIDPSNFPDIPPISNTAPQDPGSDNDRRRLRGAPAPLPPLDTTVSNSIEELTVRRGMESPPALKLDVISRTFKPVITIPPQSSDSLPVGASAGQVPSRKDDIAPSGGAALNCREIRPDDFLRDPRQTFAPRTEAQNQARRERFITQMHLEVDDDVTDVDTLHAFMRHSILAVPPHSKYHECKCPGGATISIMDRSAAHDETPVPDEDDAPGNGTESNCSDRFALSDDGEDEHVGKTGRPIGRGVEAKPIHQDSGVAILTRLAAQGHTDSILENLEKQKADKYNKDAMHIRARTSDHVMGYIPIWMEGVSPNDSPWNSPLSGSPLLRPQTDYEQVPIFSQRTPPAGSEHAQAVERDLGDGLSGEENEMDELDLGDATLGPHVDGGSEGAPRPVIMSRFTEDLPESNPDYRHSASTDDDGRPLIRGTAARCDMEQGVGHGWKKPADYRGIRTFVLVVIAMALTACVGLLVFVVVHMTKDV